MNKTVINGTPLQNSIKPIEEYLVTGVEDLLPNAKNIPTGKQNINAKIEIINVSERPPQELVSTHFKPKLAYFWPKFRYFLVKNHLKIEVLIF